MTIVDRAGAWKFGLVYMGLGSWALNLGPKTILFEYMPEP